MNVSSDRAARFYLWAWGSMLIVLGAGSLLVNPEFGVGDDVTTKHLFGMFETNGWHGLAGALAGVIAVLSAWSHRRVREVALGVALLAGIVPGVVFLASGDGSAALGLIPVDVADAISLHVLPGLIGLVCVAIDRRSAESVQDGRVSVTGALRRGDRSTSSPR